MSKILQDIKIKIDETGKGQVSIDGQQLITTGTQVTTRGGMPPEVTIWRITTMAETLDQEITTDNVTIHDVETCIHIWRFDDAPAEYRALSSVNWTHAHVLRIATNSRIGTLPDCLDNIICSDEKPKHTSRREAYELGNGYKIVIWGWIQ